MSLTDEDKKWFSEEIEAMVTRCTEQMVEAMRRIQTEIQEATRQIASENEGNPLP
jgi:hypothetical protein